MEKMTERTSQSLMQEDIRMIENTIERTSQKFEFNGFGDFKLTILYVDGSNAYDSSPFRSVIEKRIKSVLSAAVTYNFDVKMSLAYGDNIEVYQFSTWKK